MNETLSPRTDHVGGLLRSRRFRDDRRGPIEGLGLTTRRGFASSVKGNPLTEADRKAKLALVAQTAAEVWGGA